MGLGYVERHKPAKGKKKSIKTAAKPKLEKILKYYFVVTGENSKFCLQFILFVPEVNKKREVNVSFESYVVCSGKAEP